MPEESDRREIEIEAACLLLEEHWKKNPAQRLGQLLVNLVKGTFEGNERKDEDVLWRLFYIPDVRMGNLLIEEERKRCV